MENTTEVSKADTIVTALVKINYVFLMAIPTVWRRKVICSQQICINTKRYKYVKMRIENITCTMYSRFFFHFTIVTEKKGIFGIK